MIQGYVRRTEIWDNIDGPGVRLIVYFQGCSLKCFFCHNPEMKPYNEGAVYTPNDVLEMIIQYKDRFKEEGGVTFSGGEPLAQSAFLAECLKLCKKEGINTCIITSGVGDDGDYGDVLDNVDLILFSLKELTDEKFGEMVEKASDKSLAFLNLCQAKNKKLWLRNFIIPGVNDTYEYMEQLADFARPLRNIEKVKLVPFHKMAQAKYDELKLGYSLREIEEINAIKCKKLEEEINNLLGLS